VFANKIKQIAWSSKSDMFCARLFKFLLYAGFSRHSSSVCCFHSCTLEGFAWQSTKCLSSKILRRFFWSGFERGRIYFFERGREYSLWLARGLENPRSGRQKKRRTTTCSPQRYRAPYIPPHKSWKYPLHCPIKIKRPPKSVVNFHNPSNPTPRPSLYPLQQGPT
jgi:hypothetical protein